LNGVGEPVSKVVLWARDPGHGGLGGCHGDSGGPCFNDKGEQCGVTQGGHEVDVVKVRSGDRAVWALEHSDDEGVRIGRRRR